MHICVYIYWKEKYTVTDKQINISSTRSSFDARCAFSSWNIFDLDTLELP